MRGDLEHYMEATSRLKAENASLRAAVREADDLSIKLGRRNEKLRDAGQSMHDFILSLYDEERVLNRELEPLSTWRKATQPTGREK